MIKNKLAISIAMALTVTASTAFADEAAFDACARPFLEQQREQQKEMLWGQLSFDLWRTGSAAVRHNELTDELHKACDGLLTPAEMAALKARARADMQAAKEAKRGKLAN